MPDLVIGHTAERTVRLWVCGDKSHRSCRLVLHGNGTTLSRDGITLGAGNDFIAVEDFAKLQPETDYSVDAIFSGGAEVPVKGRFRTFADQSVGKEFSFSFVLSSCNMPVVSIGNLLAYLLGVGGTQVALTSLELPVSSWRYKFVLIRRMLRKPLRWSLKGVAFIVHWVSGLKQPPPPPLLRSPFLKLSAIFDACAVEIVAKKSSLPAVGDTVKSSDAKGVVACSAATDDKGPDEADGEEKVKRWRLILAQVEGTFVKGAIARKASSGGDKIEKDIGTIENSVPCYPWYDRPSFFLHAGDQIYYDFPTEKRIPERNAYRLDYREAWFDDAANRYMLSHWPHYMTLDDHEIADQFACDFNPPRAVPKRTVLEWVLAKLHLGGEPKPPRDVASPDVYLKEAMVGYRDYVHARQSDAQGSEARPQDDQPLWYQFTKGDTRFFVMDTRTQRKDKLTEDTGQIIDPLQLASLCDWMSKYPKDLKFIVTSVPFVAEINEKGSKGEPKWSGQPEPRNLPNDKWDADRFRDQRDAIIDHIFNNNIERVVFLTGDMHCCYHATMQVGSGSKYTSTIIHELAGGPVNQLQLANEVEFDISTKGRTKTNVDYVVLLDQFHTQMSGVMHVKVDYVKREQVTGVGRSIVPEVTWNVIRTLTDDGAERWVPLSAGAPKPGAKLVPLQATALGGDPVMNGVITFSPRRHIGELKPWLTEVV